jgi:hypothetical protein
MTPMRPVRALFIGLAFLGILWAAPTTAAEVQEPRWGFSTDLGLWSGTTNDTTFALGFGLDYYMDQNFSFGGMALFTPVGDLTQIGIAGVAKYHLRLNSGFNLVPFAGLGILHADLNRGSGPPKSIATTRAISFPSACRWNIRSVPKSPSRPPSW